MFKTILKSFSAILFFAAFFYSCGEQPVQPPVSMISSYTTLLEKQGLVQIAGIGNGLPYIANYETGYLITAGYKKIRIEFKCESNADGSTVSLYMNSPSKKNNNIYTVSNPNEMNITADHSIDIEDPAEKIWLSMTIKMEGFGSNDAYFKYTKVSDLIIYGIR